MAVTEFAETAVVIVGYEIADGAPVVPQETLGHLGAVDVVACECGQEAPEIVAAAAREFGIEARSPVACTGFVAVDYAVGHSCAREFAEAVEQGLNAVLPVFVGDCSVHFVDFQSAAAFRGRMVFDTCGGVAYAEHYPVACGGVPVENAVGRHFRRQIEHAAGGYHSGVDNSRRVGAQMVADAARKILVIEVGYTLCPLGLRKCHYGDIAVVLPHGLGPLKSHVYFPAAGDSRFGVNHLLHGIGRGDPRSARIGPSGRVVECKFHAKARGLFGGIAEKTEPLVAHIGRRALRETGVDIEKLRFLYAGGFHGLEVGTDAFAGDVAVEPVPPCAGAGLFRRSGEAIFEYG